MNLLWMKNEWMYNELGMNECIMNSMYNKWRINESQQE